jgi:hypothetical protein
MEYCWYKRAISLKGEFTVEQPQTQEQKGTPAPSVETPESCQSDSQQKPEDEKVD